jgi:RimJ/RimL family protein N-acetyltransferase
MENTSPPIASGTLVLRCFVPEDAPKVFAMSQEAGVRTWLPDQVYGSEAHALEVLRYLIANYRDPGTPALGPYVLGVCRQDSGELIGHAGLSPLHGDVEVGFAIETASQGRGFASSAVRTLSEWSLRRFALPRIVGIVAADNEASIRVLQHADFRMTEESSRRLHGRSRLVRTYQWPPPEGHASD